MLERQHKSRTETLKTHHVDLACPWNNVPRMTIVALRGGWDIIDLGGTYGRIVPLRATYRIVARLRRKHALLL
jgi:hypothetical protein